MTQLLPPKKEVALALLERSNVDVYLDPRAKGVVVPPQFRKEPRLILKIGLNMPVPIPDLRLDDDSMSCTLSFNRSPFYCVVPWTSVFAMVGEDGRGMVWPDDVPQELAVKVVEPGVDPGASSSGNLSAGAAAAAAGTGTGAAAKRGEGTRRASARDRAQAQAQSEDAAAADRPASSRNGAAATKGTRKKKKEEGPTRPVLVSVPSGPSSPQPEATSPARPRDGVSPIPQAPSGASSRPRQPAPHPVNPSHPSQQSQQSHRRPPPPHAPASVEGAPRPKRELPPYLRVVK